MRCPTMRKRLSDDLDGALSPYKKARLDAHLERCPGCRAYRDDIVRLQAAGAPPADRSPEDWAGFERRLGVKLASAGAGPVKVGAPAFSGRKWAFAAAGSLAIAALGTYFAVIRGGGIIETAWVPYEESLAPILLEAESDPEFGALVDREIVASIEDMAPEAEDEKGFTVPLADEPLYWEGLSEDELGYIAAELEKTAGRGGAK